jgi:hypothetical protein
MPPTARNNRGEWIQDYPLPKGVSRFDLGELVRTLARNKLGIS